MAFEVEITETAASRIDDLRKRDQRRHKKVVKTLGFLEQDPHHPGLASHRYETLDSRHGEKVWESYVENRTPSAWRLWWFFGPGEGKITVVDVGPHP